MTYSIQFRIKLTLIRNLLKREVSRDLKVT